MIKIAKVGQCAVVSLFLGLPCSPLRAGEVGDEAKQNVISAPQAELPWMSGGIGDEARDEMRKAAAAYSVHLVFSNPQGAYLASVPFRVSRRNGQVMYYGISPGPLLYLKLPPGRYQIAAKLEGIWHQQEIVAGTDEHPARIAFVATAK